MKEATHTISGQLSTAVRGGAIEALPESALLALHEALSAGEVWRALVRLLRRYLPADTYNFFLHVPEFDRPQVMFSTSEVIKGLSPEELERALRLSGTIPYLTANPGVRLVTVDAVYPKRDDFLQGAYYREFLSPHGWCDVLGIPLWDEGRMIGFLALVHSTGEGEFTQREQEKARRLCPHVQSAARRVMRAYREKSVRLALQRLVRDFNRPVLLLSWEGELLFVTRTARDYLLRWSEGGEATGPLASERHPRLPDTIQASIRRVRTRYLNDLRATSRKNAFPSETVVHPQRIGLRSELRLVSSGNSALIMPSILIEFKESNIVGSQNESLKGSIDMLSAREREVVGLVCRGYSNAEIGRELGRTVGSVKQQLSVIYDKLNVRSRAKLMVVFSNGEEET